MGDEWEYFPEIKWVDSFWGETEDIENPVLIEKRSLDAVIQKTDELLETHFLNRADSARFMNSAPLSDRNTRGL